MLLPLLFMLPPVVLPMLPDVLIEPLGVVLLPLVVEPDIVPVPVEPDDIVPAPVPVEPDDIVPAPVPVEPEVPVVPGVV